MIRFFSCHIIPSESKAATSIAENSVMVRSISTKVKPLRLILSWLEALSVDFSGLKYHRFPKKKSTNVPILRPIPIPVGNFQNDFGNSCMRKCKLSRKWFGLLSLATFLQMREFHMSQSVPHKPRKKPETSPKTSNHRLSSGFRVDMSTYNDRILQSQYCRRLLFSIIQYTSAPMNSSNHTSYRRLRLRILKVISSVSFNFLHLRVSSRIALLGQSFTLGSLCFPWFAIEGGQNYSVYSSFLGGMWILVSMSILGSLILLLSARTKEYLKNRFSIHASDGAIMVYFGVFQTAAFIMGLWFMRSLAFFTKDIVFFDPPIFALAGSLLLVAGGLLVHREQRKEALNALYIENNSAAEAQLEEYRSILEKGNDKKNMSLPV